jgi:Mg-chelatase subunit ChlD
MRSMPAWLVMICCLWGCTAAPPVGPGPRPRDPPDPGGDPDGWDRDGGRPPPGYDATCDRIAVEARAEAVTVMIVLDRSGSMYDFEDSESERIDRWRPSVTAVQSLTSALEDRIAFGLMLFGSDEECGGGETVVAPAMMTAASIRSALAGDPDDVTGGGTPTASSLEMAQRELAGVDGQRFVVLVTDGAPNCNFGLDERTCRCTDTTADPGDCWADDCLDDADTVAAVSALASAGIPTYVIGYDTGIWASVMDRMAAAGGTSFTRHIPVSDGASLAGALRDIGGSVVSCSFDLSMPPGDVTYVRVTVDGATIPHESAASAGNGWQLEGDRTITLVGDDCRNVQDGEPHTIEVAVECTPVII